MMDEEIQQLMEELIVRSEEMKMKSPISTPKFVIAVSESNTVESRILKESPGVPRSPPGRRVVTAIVHSHAN